MFHRHGLIRARRVALDCFLLVRDALDDTADGQAIVLRELEIALVVRRDRHHRARAVFHQHVVSDPHGNEFFTEWIDRNQSCVDSLFRLTIFNGIRIASLLVTSALNKIPNLIF